MSETLSPLLVTSGSAPVKAVACPYIVAMARLGMDVDVVQKVARALLRRADELHFVIMTVDRLTESGGSVWYGSDGDAFQAAWRGAHRPALLASLGGVRELGATLNKNVEEQRGASGLESAAVLASITGAFWGASSAGAMTSDPIPSEPPALLDQANLAWAAEDADPKRVPQGWHEVSPEDLGLKDSDFDTSSGMQAHVFVDEHGRYILAYAGTAFFDYRDLLADGTGTTTCTDQDKSAIAVALEVKAAVERNGGVFAGTTGHSLGGRLAALGAVATNSSAVTFDAAGVSQEAAASAAQTGEGNTNACRDPGSYIDNYATITDPLTGIQAGTPLPDALGMTHILGDPDIWSIVLRRAPLEGHDMSHMIDSLKQFSD